MVWESLVGGWVGGKVGVLAHAWSQCCNKRSKKVTSHFNYNLIVIFGPLWRLFPANFTITRKCGYLMGYTKVQVPSAEDEGKASPGLSLVK